MVTKYYYLGSTRVATRRDGALCYLLGDHLGSTSATHNPTTQAVAQQWYKPYGESRWSSGTLPTDRKFTGQRRDSGTGLLFYNARWYDPAVGRFLQADTIVPSPGDPQSLNRYAYTRNNPLRYTDPTGHIQICADGDLGGGCGWERTIYTHSPVQFPFAGLDDHDREWIESGQASAAATMAETQQMLSTAASDSARTVKNITKQVVGHEIARTLPSSGAASAGIFGTLGAAGYGTSCLIAGAADSKGNVILGGWTLGGGGVMIFTAGVVGNVTWLPRASDVSQIGGVAVNFGAGIGESVVGGVDWVVSPQSNSESLHGVSINLGGGVKGAPVALPGEIHVGVTKTYLTQARFNIYDLYAALFAGW